MPELERTIVVTQVWGKDKLRRTYTSKFAWPVGSLIELQHRMTGYGSGDGAYDFTDFEKGQVFLITRYLAEDIPMYIGYILDKDDEVHEYGFDQDDLERIGILKNVVDNAEKG